jgi:anaerobic magnesium-protoporphyrin IX monomethyl ester cyclase
MRKHKIVLYNPKAVFFTMPLALLAVGSYLDPRQYQVRIIDGRLEPDPARAVLADVGDALCLGVTVLTGSPINDALRITRAARARRPDLPIVWGGWHPSLFPRETLAESGADAAVQGQGEVTFAALVARLAAGERIDDVAGMAFRRGDEVTLNPPRPLADVDGFPAHDYDLIPVERYFQLKGRRQLDYVSSLGCRFRCGFCADPFVYGRRWTALSPARVGEEVEHLWRRYRFSDLSFQDESFFTQPKRAAAIAGEFLRRGLTFSWTATMRADQGSRLDADVLDLCVASGLRRLLIGAESGSQETLDWMAKDITVQQVLDCAEMCLRHDLEATFPVIVGFPDETGDSVQATLKLARRLRSLSPRFDTPVFYYKPYPGSQIASQIQSTGYPLPTTLPEWAEFDYVSSSGPWVAPGMRRHVEAFKFYNGLAWGAESWWRRPLQQLARWRCRHDFYWVPIEKLLVERLRPGPALS